MFSIFKTPKKNLLGKYISGSQEEDSRVAGPLNSLQISN